MRSSRHDLVTRIKHTVLTGARGLIQAVLSQVLCIPLFIVTLLSTAFIALGIGFFLAPLSLTGVRSLARLQRRWAAEWSGVEIPSRTGRSRWAGTAAPQRAGSASSGS